MGRKNSKKTKQRDNPGAGKTFKGILDVTRSGMGFVIVPDLKIDIMIRPGDFNTALHGDTVIVRVKGDGNGRRMQGEVTEVMQRKRVEFIGHLELSKDFAFFIPEMDKPMPDLYIPLSALNNAKDKDRVVVRLVKWEKDGKRPVGEVVNVLDAENSNDAAMKEILLENGFPLEFPDDALEVAARIPDTISEQEIAKRKDVRDF